MEAQFQKLKVLAAEILIVGHTETPVGATTAVLAKIKDAGGNRTYAVGATTPGAEPGYAPGCEFLNSTTGTKYINKGTSLLANFQPGFGSYIVDSAPTKSTNNRIYTGTVTGTLVVGETITQATSGATAKVAVLNANGSIDVNTVTGTFDNTHLVTGGTSSATFTPAITLVDIWTPTFIPTTPIIGYKSTTAYTQIPAVATLVTTKFKFQPSLSNTIETLTSDAVSTFNLEYGA